MSLSQSSGQKGKSEPSKGQNCHGRRAIPLPNTNCRPAQEAVRDDHWKYTENPSSLVLSRLPGSGKPLRSSEKTHRPAARQWAPCLNLYQPKGKVFYFFRVTSTVKGESAWKRVGQHCARTGQGKTSAFLQQEINC